jgi:chromatin assembly factor 1 subunit B
MPGSPMSLGVSFVMTGFGFELMNRSPDGQTMMLSSADGYCSIVVFDMSELGTVHATQQHNRQLAAIAQSHSQPHPTVSSTPTPVPHSPAMSTSAIQSRPSPAPSRTDREGSSVSSINFPPQSSSTPLFIPPGQGGQGQGRRSSTTSSIEPVLPTPGEENDGFAFPRISVSGSESGQSASGAGKGEGVKRDSGKADEAPKKKRRVMLSKVADE